MYETNLISVERDWYILSVAFKWQGEKKVHTIALPDFKRFKRDREDDRCLIKELWKLFDRADVVIGHNGDRFDIPKANARFIKYGLKPPSPYKSIDTLKIARSKFSFMSNKLDDLARYLGIGRKLTHTGFALWKACMVGDKKAWKRMRAYNAQDTRLLEAVYDRLKPWASSHPDLARLADRPNACPTCLSRRVISRGQQILRTRKVSRFSCSDCGAWFSGRPARAAA